MPMGLVKIIRSTKWIAVQTTFLEDVSLLTQTSRLRTNQEKIHLNLPLSLMRGSLSRTGFSSYSRAATTTTHSRLISVSKSTTITSRQLSLTLSCLVSIRLKYLAMLENPFPKSKAMPRVQVRVRSSILSHQIRHHRSCKRRKSS